MNLVGREDHMKKLIAASKKPVGDKPPMHKIVMSPCNKECLIENNNYKQCGAVSIRGYYCSRSLNHEGDHVACGVKCAIDVW